MKKARLLGDFSEDLWGISPFFCRDNRSEIQGQKNSKAIPVANERPRQVTVR